MKLAASLPWALLVLVVSYPVFAQGGLSRRSTGNGPMKIWGQPAASDWIDIESLGGAQGAATYVVPPGKVLVLEAVWSPVVSGVMKIAVRVDGANVPHQVGLSAGNMESLFLAPGAALPHFFLAQEGQLVEVERTDDGSGVGQPDVSAHFFLRGWLEDIR